MRLIFIVFFDQIIGQSTGQLKGQELSLQTICQRYVGLVGGPKRVGCGTSTSTCSIGTWTRVPCQLGNFFFNIQSRSRRNDSSVYFKLKRPQRGGWLATQSTRLTPGSTPAYVFYISMHLFAYFEYQVNTYTWHYLTGHAVNIVTFKYFVHFLTSLKSFKLHLVNHHSAQ